MCNNCGKVGHIRKACHSYKPPLKSARSLNSSKTVCQIQETEQEDLKSGESLLQVNSATGSPPIVVQVFLDETRVAIEVDTGASVSLMSEKVFRELWPKRSLSSTEVRLCGFNKDPIPLLGCCEVKVCYQGQTMNLPLVNFFFIKYCIIIYAMFVCLSYGERNCGIFSIRMWFPVLLFIG